ncbi:putative kynurenine 3-monooxygenase [Moniliophthora roreri MCA 2997]|uniref:Kynurenine 3-monooxygenase n=1 Tax=Moniliophthora roreri (strain MCA 2997) TaxID=1381753 RepID=V2XVG6_MONRO|nr:putative kynurenine 3-monooxygenase [Moniliophthora roreri MCA 2997]KAI3610724.1 putative kynurenine 3-monooxygenase [Moniliophthora roreri]
MATEFSSSRRKRAAVVGAGPVGCLAAIMLAKRGWKVSLYEGRADLRLPSSKAAAQQRSINLAISHRGIAAIHSIHPAAAERFMETVIPMRGRMIHHLDGRLDSQLYDRDGQCINSVDRALLNEDLLEEVSKTQNVELFFRHKVRSIDFDQKKITVEDLSRGDERSFDFDLCVGADGSYSTVRRQMMRVVRMDYQQEYIKHEYIELKVPAGRDNEGRPTFLLDPNHLHIWPRHSYMLIALPNKDKTFTCTLFAPSAELDRLNSPEIFLSWFESNFPDALSALGEKNLIHDYTHNPRSPLICTRVSPYHYRDRGILLGDSAHSMVPFYGQGLNCGLEDVRVLKVLFDKEDVPSIIPETPHQFEDERLARALSRYSEERHKDLIAITELAMGNYVEMRHLVATPMYLFRKLLDGCLYSLSSRTMKPLSTMSELLTHELYDEDEPTGWLPLYTMVTFRPDVSYDTVRRKALWQATILARLGYVGVTLLGVAGVFISRTAVKSWNR